MTSACAQQPETLETGDRVFFSAWGGYSFDSVKLLGKTKDATSTITGLGIRKRIKTYSNGNELYYTADIIPYIRFNYPKRDANDRPTIRKGWGFSPAGFLLKRRISNTFHPYLHTSGSMIFMEKEFPTDLSRKFNFTFNITLGSQLHFFEHTAFSFGYKFHHISNAQTGEENPGLDSNFFFISLTVY